MFRLSSKYWLELVENLIFVLLDEGFICACLENNVHRWFWYILHGFDLFMYSCRVVLFLIWLLIRNLGQGQSPIGHCLYRYCVSGKRSVLWTCSGIDRNTTISSLVSSSQYKLAFRTLLEIHMLATIPPHIFLPRL